MKKKKIEPIHPGEILKAEFLDAHDITPYRLANDISVTPARIGEIVNGSRAITADTALRLEKYFGVAAQFWLNLQARFDLATAEDKIGERLEEEVHALAV